MTKRLVVFVGLIFVIFIISSSTLMRVNDDYNYIARQAKLSAWSLAQLQTETNQFQHQLEMFLVQPSLDSDTLILRYDILWSRYQTFLHSQETAEIRQLHNAYQTVSDVFHLIKRYEQAVLSGDRELLAVFYDQMLPYQIKIRDIMVKNFTGASSLQEIMQLERNKNLITYNLLLVVAFIGFLAFQLYRNAKKQQFLAWRDSLSGLYNRNYLIRKIERKEHKKRRYVVFLLDIDNFKEVNDALGYEVGDKILLMVAHLLSSLTNYHDVKVIRLASDEFSVLIGDLALDYVQFAYRVRKEVNRVLATVHGYKNLTVSIGVACSWDISYESDTYQKRGKSILNNADLSLNIAKAQSNSAIFFYSGDLEKQYRQRKNLIHDLEHLLKDEYQNQLFLCYQPIIIKQKNKLGCEALLRWNHPVYGYINPEYLITIAEQSGLARPLGLWILKSVCNIYLSLSIYRGQIEFSINLSDALFDERLTHVLVSIFLSNDVDMHSIILEITETMTLEDMMQSNKIIREIQQLGVRVAMDDFGTGWASLKLLNDLPFDKLKIDKSFTDKINLHDKQEIFIRSIIDLSHQLGIKVVAEGIEELHQYKMLMDLGTDEFQGYYFSKPLPSLEFEQYCHQYFTQQQTATIT